MKWIVPLSDVTVGEEEVAAASETLRSGWLTQGARVKAFEDAFAEMLGVPHALAVTNGTAALHLAYAAADLERGTNSSSPLSPLSPRSTRGSTAGPNRFWPIAFPLKTSLFRRGCRT
jgi:hypothetical protein